MSAPEHPQVHVPQSNQQVPHSTGKSATSSGVVALILTGIALLSAPAFLLVPYIGFLPALLAAAGVVVAGLGLGRRGSSRGTATTVTGLIVSIVVFALLAGIATMWNLVVADPAIRDYDELHEVIEYIQQLIIS